MKNIQRVLIINPFGVGDCLFADPMLSNIKHAYPNAFISYVTNDRTALLLRHHPFINTVISYERDAFVAASKKGPIHLLKTWLSFIQLIKKTQSDVVIDLSLNRMFGAIAWIVGIPRRIGYDYKRRGFFLTHKIMLKGYDNKHVVQYYNDLLKFLDVPVVTEKMSLHVGNEADEWALQWLKQQQVSNFSKLVAVVPGGGASWGGRADRKRWPAEKYAQLIDKMVADLGVTVVLFGDAKEEGLARAIADMAASPIHSVVGQTSLLQMAALLKYCSFAVVNDGGPLHIAVAVNVKTISIFGPVDDIVYGPFPREGHNVVKAGLPCQPCYRRFVVASCEHLSCLKELSVEDVYRKVKT